MLDASAGHWRAQVAVTHPPPGLTGSTPARRTQQLMAPSSTGKDTTLSRWRRGFDSRRGYCSLCSDRRVAEWQTREPQVLVPVLGVGVRVSPRRLREGRCSAESHKLGVLGSTPRPATLSSESPGRQTGKAASLRGWCLWVRLPLRRLHRPVVQRPGRLPHTQDGAGSSPAGTTRFPRSAGVTAACLRGREAVRVRVPSGPLVRGWGLLVQQQDACPACGRSGCDSPAVH